MGTNKVGHSQESLLASTAMGLIHTMGMAPTMVSATQGMKVDSISTAVGAIVIELMTVGASCKPQQFALLCVRSQTAQEYSHSSHILLY